MLVSVQGLGNNTAAQVQAFDPVDGFLRPARDSWNLTTRKSRTASRPRLSADGTGRVNRRGSGRWLLAAYPRSYRRQHGPEILATVTQTSVPGRIPPVREIVGLLRGGLATRPRDAAQGPTPWWADGIHLGVFLLALTTFAPGSQNNYDAIVGEIQHPGLLFNPWWYPWSNLLPLLVALALMRVWVWIALPPAVVMAFGEVRFLFASHGHPQGINLFPAIPVYGFPAPTAGQALASLLILSGAHRARGPAIPCAAAPVLVLVATGPGRRLRPGGIEPPTALPPWQTYLTLVLLMLAVWATAISGDLRWTLAFGITVAARVLSTIHNLTATLRAHNSATILYSGGAALLSALMVLTARRARHRTG